jgi:hypothetical protein
MSMTQTCVQHSHPCAALPHNCSSDRTESHKLHSAIPLRGQSRMEAFVPRTITSARCSLPSLHRQGRVIAEADSTVSSYKSAPAGHDKKVIQYENILVA